MQGGNDVTSPHKDKYSGNGAAGIRFRSSLGNYGDGH
jgi:hypothetical protein